MVETVRAVNFRLVGKEKEGLAEELQQANYMVKLRCLANYEDIFLVAKDLGKSHTLPRQENISDTVGEISIDRLANSLTTLPASYVFPGQLCAARFSQDEAVYRTEVISVKDQVVRVMFIDKSISEAFMLPEVLLVTAPYAAMVTLSTRPASVQ